MNQKSIFCESTDENKKKYAQEQLKNCISSINKIRNMSDTPSNSKSRQKLKESERESSKKNEGSTSSGPFSREARQRNRNPRAPTSEQGSGPARPHRYHFQRKTQVTPVTFPEKASAYPTSAGVETKGAQTMFGQGEQVDGEQPFHFPSFKSSAESVPDILKSPGDRPGSRG